MIAAYMNADAGLQGFAIYRDVMSEERSHHCRNSNIDQRHNMTRYQNPEFFFWRPTDLFNGEKINCFILSKFQKTITLVTKLTVCCNDRVGNYHKTTTFTLYAGTIHIDCQNQ